MKFSTLTFLVWLSLIARAVTAAEPAAKLHPIGFLTERSSANEEIATLKKELGEIGYVDGETMTVFSRSSGGHIERIDEAAAALIQQKPDLIVADGVSAGQAARRQTRSVPIVVASRLESVRAGGNVTGATNISADLGIQRLRLLKEISPSLSRIAILWHEVNPIPSNYIKQVRKAADSIGVGIDPHKLKSSSQFQATFDALAASKDDGAIIESQLLFTSRMGEIVGFLSKGRLASVSGVEEFAAAGGLVSYGLSVQQMWHHTAVLIDRIFKQRKPKSGQPLELPTAQPDKFQLVVNLKTAAQLRLAVSPEVLKRADKVIK